MLRVLLIGTLVGCGSRSSIEIFFPNQTALDATKRVRIELHDPEGENCIDFAQRVADDETPRGTPSQEDDVPAPFDEIEIEDVPRGAQLVIAYAHGDDGRDTPPFLAGCTDKYDSTGDDGDPEDVPIVLQHIPYATLRISEASGNRQAGRPGERLPRPLRVLADANTDGRAFPIPGLEIQFRTENPFALGNDTTEHPVLTGSDGIAETTVLLPLEPDIANVRATSSLLENVEVTFTVSALAEIRLQSQSRIIDFPATPVALAAGAIDGSGTDLIALGSENGASRLMVADSPLIDPTPLPVPQDLGTSPVAVTAFDSQIAVLNARSTARENGELRLLVHSAGAIVLDDTHVLTASNAVGVATIGRSAGQLALAVAASGRSNNDRPCVLNQCGCPPDEFCVGDVCRAHDGVVLVLSPDPARPGKLIEEGRCEEPITSVCSKQGCCVGRQIACETDDCACEVPQRARLGSWQGPLDPRSIAAAPLRISSVSELLIPTQAGLHRLDQTPQGFRDTAIFILSANITSAVSAGFDLQLDGAEDVAWLENAACVTASSIDEICPTVTDVPDARGCLGFLLTEQSGRIPELSPPDGGLCRRHHLPFVPGAICLAQIDDDMRPDVVVSAPAEDRIYLYAGDGLGGILEPPQVMDAPSGPMVCADLDGNGTDDIAIADESQPGRFYFLYF